MLQGKCAKEATESTAREGSHEFAVPVQFREDPIGVQENNPAQHSICIIVLIDG